MGDVRATNQLKKRIWELVSAATNVDVLLHVEHYLLENGVPAGQNESANNQEKMTSVDEDMRLVFQTFDTDDSGTIDRRELCRILCALDPSLWDAKRVDRLLSAMDKDNSKAIDFDEFCKWLRNTEVSIQKDRFLDAVKRVSVDCDRVVSTQLAAENPYPTKRTATTSRPQRCVGTRR